MSSTFFSNSRGSIDLNFKAKMFPFFRSVVTSDLDKEKEKEKEKKFDWLVDFIPVV